MAFKESMHRFLGMNRDISKDKSKSEYYFDAKNIRLTVREEDGTLLAVTNEKGSTILSVPQAISNFGTYIGHAIINNYLIIFDIINGIDRISRIDLTNTLNGKILYSGNLNFNINNKIECIVSYENENVQKVYWTDGLNQPRMINIAPSIDEDRIDEDFDNQFDISIALKGDEIISITKNLTGGYFTAGTIQYFFTYATKDGKESKIFYQSPLLYTSEENSGGEVNTTCTNSFTINITNLNNQYEYVKIYSILRTSIDTTPNGRLVATLDIPKSDTDSIEYLDIGNTNSTVNPNELTLLGAENITVETMTHKDNVLFLGNIQLKDPILSDELKNNIKALSINSTMYETSEDGASSQYYKYNTQLNLSISLNRSNSIKGFKTNESYRLGLQFQDKYGKWSQPAWVSDYAITNYPQTIQDNNITHIRRSYPSLTIDTELKQGLTTAGFIKVRPVVVLPKEYEREILCQGVINPTVFQYKNRINSAIINSGVAFAQPSWFYRPYPNQDKSNIIRDSEEIDQYIDKLPDHRNHPYGVDGSIYNSKGSWVAYRHGESIYGGLSRAGEIEGAYCITDSNGIVHNNPYNYTIYNFDDAEPVDAQFYVDSSIITMDSPEIEFTTLQDTKYDNDYQFNIVGIIPITGFKGDLKITTSKLNNLDGNLGLYSSVNVGALNFNNDDGGNILLNGAYWRDRVLSIARNADNRWTTLGTTGFVVYPWHSTGAFNKNIYISGQNPTESQQGALLENKIIANLRYSPLTNYLSTVQNISILDAQLVDRDRSPINRIKYGFAGDNITEVFYYNDEIEGTIADYGQRNIITSNVVSIESNLESEQFEFDKYRIWIEDPESSASTWTGGGSSTYFYSYNQEDSLGLGTNTDADGVYNLGGYYSTLYQYLNANNDEDSGLPYQADTPALNKSISVPIKYKANKHIVLSLGKTSDNKQLILPSIKYSYTASNIQTTIGAIDSLNPAQRGISGISNFHPIYYNPEATIQNIAQNTISVNNTPSASLFIGELKRSVSNKFGGTTEEALKNNEWIPAGNEISLENTGNITIDYTEGDTYYQRFDCLKTSPAVGSVNNIVEILSFMCETRVNIDGRYDRRRGVDLLTSITSENFNLINPAYTQNNNFLSYKILDKRFELSKFPTQITWTKPKVNGALEDNWTNITLINTLDLDGDKGKLVSLNRLNNDIIAFQEQGLSQIIFNPNIQLNTSNGLPIELANSGRVEGKRYFSESIGCQNKWTINEESPNGLYFVDSNQHTIYNFNGKFIDISDNKGFRSWVINNEVTNTWYDRQHKDMYFKTNNTVLAYSELLDQFTSFYDYQNANVMFNYSDKTYAIANNYLHQLFSNNEYGKLLNPDNEYASCITFIENDNPLNNKTFTNLEFRGDMYSYNNTTSKWELQPKDTFDTLQVTTEYQDTGVVSLQSIIDRPSNLAKKFRVWRIQIPRDSTNNRDRIMNTWCKITLSKNTSGKKKWILYDVTTKYFI